MNLSARTVGLTLAGIVLGLAVALAARAYERPAVVVVPPNEAIKHTGAAAAERHAVGMSGCLAAACHGGPASKVLKGERGDDCWQSSGSVWAAADPHAAAYSLLTDNPRRVVKVTAAKIMAKFAPGTSATDDARCLACHTNPALAATKELIDNASARVLREQGVSCEACHGNAGAWLQPHTAWKGDRKEVYEKHGLRPMYDLGERALACAGCHVGAPAEPGPNGAPGLPVRDMNHDMIAAGHPRLAFDFAEYQRRLPHHWQEKDRTTGKAVTRNEAKVWYVGRVAHAEAACKLLTDRATRNGANDPRSPWPEFAEFNCAACHHNLRMPERETIGVGADWRRSDAYLGAEPNAEPPISGRPLGAPPWQTIWPMTFAPGLESPTRGDDKTKRSSDSMLRDVILLMEQSRPAKASDAGPKGKAGADAMTKLRRELVTKPDAEVEALARAYFPKGATRVPEWDSAAQLFYGLVALEYARGTPDDATVKKYRDGVAAFRSLDPNDKWPATEKKWKNVNGALDALLIRPR